MQTTTTTKTTKNLFPALSAVLKVNKITLEKEEFKAVLDHINGKIDAVKVSPLAEKVIEVFEVADLEDGQFYLVKQNASAFDEVAGKQAVAKTRAQLLAILISPEMLFPEIQVMSFGKLF